MRRPRRTGQWGAEQWSVAALAAEIAAPSQWMASESAVPSTAWRFSPASWQTDHRSLLDGTYGSTAYGMWVAGPSDYAYATHDDGTGTYVGTDPGPHTAALTGLIGHEVQLPAGNSTEAEVAALFAPVLETFTEVTGVVDNADGTLTVQGLSDGDLGTGTTFADRSGAGVMGVQIAALVVGDGGTGGLNNIYLSRLVVPSTPGTGPRLPRLLRVWVHSVDLSDAPRVMLYSGDATAPAGLFHDFGQIDVASIVAPGWVDLWLPADFTDTLDGGDYLYLAIRSTANLTTFRFMSSGSSYRGDWDGTFALYSSDGSMSGSAAVAAEPTWLGAITGPLVAVLFPAQIVWADTDALTGDGSLVREWGSPRSEPIASFPNVTVLPGSLVHMIAPGLDVLGLRLGERHLGVGAHTSTGSMRCEFWEGDAALLDPTAPHNPNSDGLEVVHDYGAETALTPAAWNDLPEPEEPVYLTPGAAWAVSVHSDGTDGTEIRFELTGTGLPSTINVRTQAYDWYPVDGLVAGDGSELEAYDPSVTIPPRVAPGNATIVIDPGLPAATPHQQDASDIWQGNCPAIGVTLYLDGMGPA